jgi:hypothetical protein
MQLRPVGGGSMLQSVQGFRLIPGLTHKLSALDTVLNVSGLFMFQATVSYWHQEPDSYRTARIIRICNLESLRIARHMGEDERSSAHDSKILKIFVGDGPNAVDCCNQSCVGNISTLI